METVRELTPRDQQVGAQRRSHPLLKLYLLGSVLALVGAVLALVDTVCSPFSAASRQHAREAALCELGATRQPPGPQVFAKSQPDSGRGSRTLTPRQHAS